MRATNLDQEFTMSKRTQPNVSKQLLRMLALPLAVSMSLQSFAWAQDDTEEVKTSASDEEVDQLDEVVVKGFRASLEKSLTLKREAVGQLDSIVAEDIGKFPDLNLAESLQRIPGVTITRDGGEGRNISVRGLGPQFVRVRINGIEAMSSTGGTDASGGVNRGRGFDFNVFASELFSNLTVHKTAAANIEEGSLGATVDLRTARPFDYGERVAQIAADPPIRAAHCC
jgi:iron complex outermembrane recepter protein